MARGFAHVQSREQKPKLSLCMIVKNEEHCLQKCLDSAKPVADEIIIVDTGSSDRTIKIAKRATSKVYHFPWCDDFSQARNYSLSKASGQWILVLDADEVLLKPAIPLIRQIVNQQNNIIAVNLLRQEIGENQVPYSWVCRLFRNRNDLRFSGIYHEQIDQALMQIRQLETHWQIANLEQPAILHGGYTSAEIHQTDKYHFAERLMLKHLQLNPEDVYIKNKLGALYITQGKATAGLELLLQSWQNLQSQTGNEGLQFEVLYHLGFAYQHLDQPSQAIAYYQTALNLPVSPWHKLAAWHNLGGIFYNQQDFNSAIACYREVIAIDPHFKEGHNNLGLALRRAGQTELAIASYQRGIALDPEYADAHCNLAVALLKSGNVQQAKFHFKSALQLYRQQNQTQTAEELLENLQDLGLRLE
jgi:glycosyltransferase involved in cell wall biosynthesis